MRKRSVIFQLKDEKLTLPASQKSPKEWPMVVLTLLVGLGLAWTCRFYEVASDLWAALK